MSEKDPDAKYAIITASSRELAEEVIRGLEPDGSSPRETPLAVLHYRGGEEELQLGIEYCARDNPLERIVGAKILAELKWNPDHFREESVPVLIGLLQDEDERVIASAASSLGHRHDARAIPYLAALADHPNPQIRKGVTGGLSGQTDPQAVSSMIRLMKDGDRDVRNWAVFEVGTLLTLNTPEICSALFEALDEEDDEIHGEAMVGLALRGDQRVVPVLMKWWEENEPYGLALEAAEAIADPQLAPQLRKLLYEMDTDEPAEWKIEVEDWRESEPRWRDEVVSALAACGG